MGIAYRSDSATGLTVAVIDGSITKAEFHEFALRQDQDPDWHATTRSLTDPRTAVTPTYTSEQLSAYAALYARMRANDKPFLAAIVAGLDFELAGSYGDFRTADGSRTIAFNGLAPACVWLGADLASTSATRCRTSRRASSYRARPRHAERLKHDSGRCAITGPPAASVGVAWGGPRVHPA